MKTLSFILLISLALSTTFAQTNLRKENEVKLNQKFNFPVLEGDGGFEVVYPKFYMKPEEMYNYVKNEFNRYEGFCARTDVFAKLLQLRFKVFAEMTYITVLKMIQKYDKSRQDCFYYEDFLAAYNGLHLGD